MSRDGNIYIFSELWWLQNFIEMVSADGVFPERVILPLLALGGIALWINYCNRKRLTTRKACYCKKRPTTRKACYYCRKTPTNSAAAAPPFQEEAKQAEVDDAKEDYLSQLPDGVLSSILANLNIRDAARTSVLSARWKHLFTSTPTLRFNCLCMFGFHYLDHNCYRCYQENFLKVVNQLLQLYSGRRVAHIEMVFCFWKEFPSELDHLLRCISRLGVERLCLSFDCFVGYPIDDSRKMHKLPLELLNQASLLKHLILRDCIVLPSPEVRFNSLATLTLRGVVLASGQLEGVLSSCFNLKQLTVEHCEFPYKLRLASTVTTVVFLLCDGVKEVDLHAANLRTLVYKFFDYVRFSFSFVPVLENVMVYCGEFAIPCIFGDFGRHLSAQLKSLTLKCCPIQVNYFPTENMFGNLRQLSLILLHPCGSFDIVKLSSLLGACPLLRYLSLTITNKGTAKDERGIRRPPLSPTYHSELKEVTFNGFDGTGSEVEFVLYILRSAIVLERMFLSPRRYCFGSAWKTSLNVSSGKRKVNPLQQKLRRQAISRTAVVIVQ